MPSQLMKRRQSDGKLHRREESLTGFLELFYPKHQEKVNLLMNRFSMASASSISFNHNLSKVSHRNTSWKNDFSIGHNSYNDTNTSILKDKDPSFVFDLDASDFIVDPSDSFEQQQVQCSSDNMNLLMNRLSKASASLNSFNHNLSKVSHQNTPWKNAFPIGNKSYNDTNTSVLKDKVSSFVFDLDASDFIVDPKDYLGQQQKQVEDLDGFCRAIQESVESTQWLQTWDRNMGLKKCHSRTMTNSTNSRKKLKCMFQIKEKRTNDDIRPLRIFSLAAA